MERVGAVEKKDVVGTKDANQFYLYPDKKKMGKVEAVCKSLWRLQPVIFSSTLTSALTLACFYPPSDTAFFNHGDHIIHGGKGDC